MKKGYKLSHDLIKNLIDYVTLYAISKIYNQYVLIKKINKHSKKFKKCTRIFIITISLSCSHKIKKVLKIEKKKLLFENMHFY